MNDLLAPFFALARPSHLWFELDRFLLINVSSSFLLEYDTIPIFWFLLLIFLHWIYDFLKLIDDIFYFHFLEKLQFLRSFRLLPDKQDDKLAGLEIFLDKKLVPENLNSYYWYKKVRFPGKISGSSRIRAG